MKINLVGPFPPPIGGATVLYQLMVDYLNENYKQVLPQESEIHTFDTNSFSISWLIKLCSSHFKSDVTLLNLSKNGFRLFFPFLFFINVFARKKLVLRVFGGWLKSEYETSGFFFRVLFRYALTKIIIVVETEDLNTWLNEAFDNLQLALRLPNCRKKFEKRLKRGDRFVFIGRVCKEKGVDELIEVAKSNSIYIDIYGPLDGYTSDELNNIKYVNYLGVISPSSVTKVIASYKALVLPTFYSGEGYPGVIIEAFASGTPVVSTKWRAIPELVIDYQSGILVEPKSSISLGEALRVLQADKLLWEKLSRGARSSFSNYDERVIHQKFFRDLMKHI
ncbi:glycosyltransferase [Pseudoalteromonas sp. SG43-6]|uniref:glycosyltransferase n=1 Tax=Pseudoalteromonas sp. SG43-6 TaxID=2760967 RepID=UPI0016002988|nr:glycosyltransferase [Pseudoalteromonas sp. SG43-6]MBB1436758.1 glycosyltransferase [Pseudoalteromonas sp. SG43-6]